MTSRLTLRLRQVAPLEPTHRAVRVTVPCSRVLVIDPDPALARWMALNLELHRLQVHSSPDLQSLPASSLRAYDLLLMAAGSQSGPANRPGQDACQQLRQLRKADARLPVLVMHASADTADRTVALESGADAVMPKPLSSREFRARVRNLMQRAHEQRRRLAVAGPLARDDPSDPASPPGLDP